MNARSERGDSPDSDVLATDSAAEVCVMGRALVEALRRVPLERAGRQSRMYALSSARPLGLCQAAERDPKAARGVQTRRCILNLRVVKARRPETEMTGIRHR